MKIVAQTSVLKKTVRVVLENNRFVVEANFEVGIRTDGSSESLQSRPGWFAISDMDANELTIRSAIETMNIYMQIDQTLGFNASTMRAYLIGTIGEVA